VKKSIESCSEASRVQRAGRVGRELGSTGFCYRVHRERRDKAIPDILYPEDSVEVWEANILATLADLPCFAPTDQILDHKKFPIVTKQILAGWAGGSKSFIESYLRFTPSGNPRSVAELIRNFKSNSVMPKSFEVKLEMDTLKILLCTTLEVGTGFRMWCQSTRFRKKRILILGAHRESPFLPEMLLGLNSRPQIKITQIFYQGKCIFMNAQFVA